MKKSSTKYSVYAVLLSILSATAVWAQCELSAHDPLFIGIAAALFFCFRIAFICRERRVVLCSSLLGLLFTLFMVLGKLYALSDAKNYAVWLVIRFFGLWTMFSAVLTVLFCKLTTVELIDRTADRSGKKCRLVFLLSFLIFTAVYSLWWLYEYPGNTSPDSNNQLMQVLGLMPLRSNHPAVSTLFLKLLFVPALSFFDGNQNAALAFYTFIQLLLMAAIYAYIIESIYESGVKKAVVISLVLLYALHPIYGSYSVTVWKDVLFSGFIATFCTTLWRLIRKYTYTEKRAKGWEIVLLYLSGLFAGLFRNQCYYAFLLLFPFVFFVFRKKSRIIQFMPLAVFLTAMLINGPVFSAFDIKHSDVVESLSLPAQHIARVISDGNTLSEEQYELLSKVVDVEQVRETYNANISDPIKALIRTTGDIDFLTSNKAEYFRLWLELGLQHPLSYLNAQIDQTKGYWYPDISYWAMSNYCQESDVLTIFKVRHTPAWLTAIFDEIGFYLPHLPISGLFFSIGTAVWLTIALFFFCLYHRRKAEAVVFIPLIALILTLIAVTPVYAEFRYAFPIFTALPLLCVVPFCGGIDGN